VDDAIIQAILLANIHTMHIIRFTDIMVDQIQQIGTISQPRIRTFSMEADLMIHLNGNIFRSTMVDEDDELGDADTNLVLIN
jgi:hypothetical protein